MGISHIISHSTIQFDEIVNASVPSPIGGQKTASIKFEHDTAFGAFWTKINAGRLGECGLEGRKEEGTIRGLQIHLNRFNSKTNAGRGQNLKGIIVLNN
jgi:hypothetical protein